MEHYRADPETGCALMMLGALAIGAYCALMIFGLEPLPAIAVLVLVALATYWLLKTFYNRPPNG